MKRLINIPIKATGAQAKALIRQKLASGDLSMGDERRLKDMYSEYAKGGDVTKKKQTAKVAKVMGEFKEGTLHSGKGGKVVKSPKQAIAIALSEAKVKAKK
jgi:uncharacterized membrane protein YkoI